MSADVFLSIGRIYTKEQEVFVSAIEDYLRENGLTPRALGRTDFSSQQPLKFIEEVMRECSGTVVIAFERLHIQNAIEFRTGDSEREHSNVKIPSVWNQIEAGMAYVLGHPLLVIMEKGLKSDGILEFGYDWYVQHVEIDSKVLEGREFIGVFEDGTQMHVLYQCISILLIHCMHGENFDLVHYTLIDKFPCISHNI